MSWGLLRLWRAAPASHRTAPHRPLPASSMKLAGSRSELLARVKSEASTEHIWMYRSTPCPSMELMDQLQDVTGVEVIGEHRLRLTFDDGTVGRPTSRSAPGVASLSRCVIQTTSPA